MTPPTGPPIDETHLDRLSGGEESQKVEILALFALEAPRLLDQAAAARNGEVRRERLGALERLARNVGAAELAGLAAGAAVAGENEGKLTALRRALDEVIAYVRTSPGPNRA